MEAEWQKKHASVFTSRPSPPSSAGSKGKGAKLAPLDSSRPSTGESLPTVPTSGRRLEPLDLPTTPQEPPATASTTMTATSSPALVSNIRSRRLELESARTERNKRRQRALAREHKLQEELEGEEKHSLLLAKLMRASQEERRIAIELTTRRSEEQVIRDNRAFREKQRAERLHRNFQEALQREAEVNRVTCTEYLVAC